VILIRVWQPLTGITIFPNLSRLSIYWESCHIYMGLFIPQSKNEPLIGMHREKLAVQITGYLTAALFLIYAERKLLQSSSIYIASTYLHILLKFNLNNY
jgi:hypothetical protein